MKKVLVVDDSISVRKALERILKPKKVEVLSADSAKVALEILEEHSPELIIADIVMPEMDGYEFCTLLKQHDRLKTIPVLLISGIVNPEVKSRAKEVKAIGIVKKPFKPDTLLYIVSLIFEKLKTRPAPVTAETQQETLAETPQETSQETPVEALGAVEQDQPAMPEAIDAVDSQESVSQESVSQESVSQESVAQPLEIDPEQTIAVDVVNIEESKLDSLEDNSPELKLADISFDESNQLQSEPDALPDLLSSEQVVTPLSAASSLSQSTKEYQPDVLEAAAKRFMDNVKVDNLWLLGTETQCLLHLGSERGDIEAEIGNHFDAFYRTAGDFANSRSYSPMNSLLLEYPETCYLLVKVNDELLMVLDFQDVSALSMVRYMMRKELPELASELEGVPIAA